MPLDERIAELRATLKAAIDDEIGVLVRLASRVREGDEAALVEAVQAFGDQPATVDFLRSLLPSPKAATEEKHLRAQRFARVRVAEIQLYHASAMKIGRASRDVYSALKGQMDAAREAYRDKFLTPANGTADYLHVEFVRTLANEDAALLGPTYPGPLV